MKYNKLIICLITFLIGVLIYKIKNINRTEGFSNSNDKKTFVESDYTREIGLCQNCEGGYKIHR